MPNTDFNTISKEALLEIVEGFTAGETSYKEDDLDDLIKALKRTKICLTFTYTTTPDKQPLRRFMDYEFIKVDRTKDNFICTRDPNTELPVHAAGIGFRSMTKWSNPGFYKRYDSASQEAAGTKKQY